ncbi:hypothetical protein ACIQU3_07490 [Streptomyces sp. NPDC101110]|uniref:phage terminase small subunit n=1 Tax=Streptomyces sp. NPDC101110 TaxID=3366104 RepID=UPI00381B7406
MISTTRRGNYAPRQDKIQPILIDAVCTLPVPPLPTGRTWTDRECQRWQELWTSSAANLWAEDVVGIVAVYVVLESQFLNGRISAGVLGEFRQIAEQLALTPASRIRLNIRIREAGE